MTKGRDRSLPRSSARCSHPGHLWHRLGSVVTVNLLFWPARHGFRYDSLHCSASFWSSLRHGALLCRCSRATKPACPSTARLRGTTADPSHIPRRHPPSKCRSGTTTTKSLSAHAARHRPTAPATDRHATTHLAGTPPADGAPLVDRAPPTDDGGPADRNPPAVRAPPADVGGPACSTSLLPIGN